MVDARGLSCPIPVVMTMDEMKKENCNEIEVLVDSMVCVENITRLSNNNGYDIKVSENEDGDYLLKLRKK